MFGILNINKPSGWTSRDVVNRVQRLVRPAKAGHAGTLDPLATGVLVVCVGPATRLITYVQQMSKVYQASFLLGQTSPSEDVEETLTPVVDAPVPTLAQIEARLPDFTGLIQQRPPAYSALKVQGRRAYALARAGEEVILAARPVTIEQLQVLDYAYPRLELKLRCGSGTYVRSLGRDLAESLGTGAVMQNLVRTAIGPFTVESALDLETLDEAQLAQGLHAPLEGVAHLPQLRLDDLQLAELRHGRRISAEALLGTSVVPPEAVYAAVGTGGELVALVAEKRPGWLGPVCNFSQSS